MTHHFLNIDTINELSVTRAIERSNQLFVSSVLGWVIAKTVAKIDENFNISECNENLEKKQSNH